MPSQKQDKFEARGPNRNQQSALQVSKSQMFMPMKTQPVFFSEMKQPPNREEMSSRNSVIRISHMKNTQDQQAPVTDRPK